ncbi:hypothetical protein VH12019_00095 [Vibrio phage VH1_2019]|uniref:Uncharacterized protein n=1 Tax=Vibrio phage VH1_2019 TaxID=2686307 RepID=A0A6B9SZ09_9CAUD|nr:hypothetical protein VH12019_00095 [Vibrio phage VH1_2019]
MIKSVKALFSKRKWNVVGRSENLDLWTVTTRRPQVKCRLLLKEDQYGNRDYELDMLDDSPVNYNSSIRYCMIDQIIPREYIHKFLKGWSVDKINRIYGKTVFTIEKTPYESFKDWR